MAKDQRVTLKIKLSDGTTKDVAFTVPGGKDGASVGYVAGNEPESQPLYAIEAKYNEYNQGLTMIDKPTVFTYRATKDDGSTISAGRNLVIITVEPMGDGQVVTWEGLNTSAAAYNNYVWKSEAYYVEANGDNRQTLRSNLDPMVVRHDVTLLGEGSTANELQVRVSTREGNSLQVVTDEGEEGLFAAGGSGGLTQVSVSGTSLSGMGTQDQPLKVVLSPQPDNVLKDESGLYVPPMTITHDDSITGAGTEESPLAVKVSAEARNALKLLTEADTDNFGLYAEAFVVDLPAGTNLATVTTPGRYRIKGEANGGAVLGFPVAVYTNSEVYMDVVKAQSSSSGNGPIVTQYFYATFLNNRPGPYTRVLANSAWTAWSPLATEDWVTKNAVNWKSVSQNNLSLINVYSNPTYFGYKADDGTDQTPEGKTLPSALPGVAFQLSWPWSTSTAGQFGGLVMALDADGDLYVNVDRNYPTSSDGTTPDQAIDWHKFVWVPKDWVPPQIPVLTESATTAEIIAAVNQIRDVLSIAGLVTIGV